MISTNRVILINFPSNDGSGVDKYRPSLAIKTPDGSYLVFPITSKYEGKSDTIKANFYEILDLKEAGLRMKSWVDTGTPFITSESSILSLRKIGKLSARDANGLSDFI
ncbi:type II toxin-antitoxin system PemK/MazF family toxin [Vagococcus fluvialis]|uniref:type II toxin-antitoxin system PemK/MazF family toxin n=1 Tax=Vagococcus fluvialis TaxID=2738 RepID=UPI001D0B0EC6|nr:hypothetical protein [Vagococcus fluvialis]UDM72715.1 hypothetical protein K5L00_15120 [Vagococcus fluvialis]UDM83990.1 hypothetical protein K5K96_15145 [Vagococcus fluvialis]